MMIKYFTFILILFCFNFSKAQDSSLTLKQQLDRLQREVSDLSKTVFTSSRDTKSQKNQQINENLELTAFDLRIYDLEKDIKRLNENFEELIFQIDDLNNLYKKLNIDIANLFIDSEKINNTENLMNKASIKQEDLKMNQENLQIDQKNSLGTIVINSQDLSDKNEEQIDQTNNLYTETNKLSPEEEFQNAFDMLRGQKFDDAKIALKNYIKNHKDHKFTGSAHYWLGEIYLLKKEYREAALILAEGYQKFPKSIKAPDMLYKLSESLISINKKEDACNTLNKLNEEFPNHILSSQVQNKIISLDCLILTE